MKIKKVYVILILNDEVIDLKTKIIAIVIAVVITAGTATGVGVVVKQNNDKHTEELVNAAVSQALATSENTAIAESTTEEATTEESTTRKHLGAPQPTTTTKTTEEPQVIYDTKPKDYVATTTTKQITTRETTKKSQDKDIDKSDLGTETPLGYVKKTDETKHKDDKGYYWETDFKYYRNGNKANSYDYFIDEEDYLFFFEDGRRVYYVTHN